ncbi:ATP-binding protein [Achromobacter sp. JD417]|uniref:AAA family ATPase n=1 Tax=Achromobacter sp. JD417 TaxID=2893881 RepID=UPI0035A5FBE0
MLVSANIIHFRTCRNVSLTGLDEMVVLLGYNGAGKTNILHALLWAAQGGLPELPALKSDEGHVQLEISLGSKQYVYEVQRWEDFEEVDGNFEFTNHVRERLVVEDGNTVTSLFDREDATLSVFGQETLTIPPTAGAIQTILSFYGGHNAPVLKAELDTLSAFLEGIKYYPLRPADLSPGGSSRMFSWMEYTSWKKIGKTSIDSDLEANLLLLDAWLNNRDKFDEFAEILGPSSLGVIDRIRIVRYVPTQEKTGESASYRVDSSEVSANDVAKTKTIFSVGFYPAQCEEAVRFRDLSMGTQRIVQLMAHMIFDSFSIALVEQPEDGLHPAMLRRVMSILDAYRDNLQCIVTSHSPDVFNMTTPENVRIVELREGHSSVTPLTQNQIAQARRYLQDEGTLAEYLESL